jgi:NADH-quinone oxidoreductase subunit L
MFLGLGIGVPAAAVFHLVTHAFFKALLFLGAGSVIHGLSGEQDMSRMGGLAKAMPVTCATMAVGTLAIAGVPPFSGFFSKDEIIWGAFAGPHAMPALGVIGFVVALLTSYYTGRLFCMTFLGRSRVTEHAKHHLHESPAVMTGPLVVLALLAFAGGFIPIPEIIAPVVGEAELPHAPLWMLGLATLIAVGGLAIAYALWVVRPERPAEIAAKLGALPGLARDRFLVDEFYDATVVRPVFASASIAATTIDAGLIDGTVNGAGTFVAATSGLWRRFQTGNVQHYALSFLVGALVLLAYYVGR